MARVGAEAVTLRVLTLTVFLGQPVPQDDLAWLFSFTKTGRQHKGDQMELSLDQMKVIADVIQYMGAMVLIGLALYWSSQK